MLVLACIQRICGIFNIRVLAILSLIIIMLDIIMFHFGLYKLFIKKSDILRKQINVIECLSINPYLLIIVAIISLSPIIWFKYYSKFPLQYYNPSFVIHSHQILRIIDKNIFDFIILNFNIPLNN